MLKNRLKTIVIATILTALIAFFSITIPAVFAGAVIYSIIKVTAPKDGIFDYIKDGFLFVLAGVIGWEIYILSVYHDLDFTNLNVPAFFSFLYYNILIIISQYTD